MFRKLLTIGILSTSLTSCLFDRTTIESSQSSLAGGGSANMSLYVKFSDITTCSNGAVLTYNGTAFSCVSAGVMTQTNITTGGASYIVTNAQNNVMLTYNDSVDGVISLPSIASVSNGFLVTVARQVPYKVLIQAGGADSFPDGTQSLEMVGENLSSVSIVVAQGKWQLVNQTDDCKIGKTCWGANHIYVGKFNGHQYFTTPSGCTNSATPTCAGGADTVMKPWANNSGTSAYNVNTGATNFNDGKAQSAMLATTYTDTEAAQFCENMTYAGYSDWYLPAKAELEILYRARMLTEDWNNWYYYWSSTEYYNSVAVIYYPQSGSSDGNDKTTSLLVRCVRRF